MALFGILGTGYLTYKKTDAMFILARNVAIGTSNTLYKTNKLINGVWTSGHAKSSYGYGEEEKERVDSDDMASTSYDNSPSGHPSYKEAKIQKLKEEYLKKGQKVF